jgi:hypothetical protein
MKNPNGPSIEEKEQMAEELLDRNADYNAGWNAALKAIEKRVAEVEKDWRERGSDQKVFASEYITTIIWKHYKK